ncbi:MAG: hypothetical protein IT252_10830 [Chitinophagaceae bacterium]|nr:hypothetical protein [Chitinophagaceae bacterium]
MSDSNLFQPDKLSIVDFRIQQAQMENPEAFELSQVVGHKVGNELNVGYNLELKLAKADLVVKIQSDSGGHNAEEAMAKFHFVYIFKVENLDELTRVDGEGVEIDGRLANAIASVAYSTSRGVLLTRLQGTALQDFVLPVIDPNELLTNLEHT